MAAGHGHVYNIEYTGKHCPNIDTATTSSFDITGVGPSFQLDMRNPDIRGAFHEVVVMGYFTGLRGRGADRLLRCDPLANT